MPKWTRFGNAYVGDEVFNQFIAGTQTAGTKKWGFVPGFNWQVVAVRARLDTAPTGAAFKVDVNKNGTTLYTTQANQPTIAISGNDSTVLLPDVLTGAASDRLTVDIDQIGSGTAGADFYVTVILRRI